MIEGLRALDTRDWDEDEVEAYLREVLEAMPLGVRAKDMAALLLGKSEDHFN